MPHACIRVTAMSHTARLHGLSIDKLHNRGSRDRNSYPACHCAQQYVKKYRRRACGVLPLYQGTGIQCNEVPADGLWRGLLRCNWTGACGSTGGNRGSRCAARAEHFKQTTRTCNTTCKTTTLEAAERRTVGPLAQDGKRRHRISESSVGQAGEVLLINSSDGHQSTTLAKHPSLTPVA